jgi:hypothetical protein
MKSIATLYRLLLLTLMVLSFAPPDARGEPAAADAQRARKFAAHRYVGMAIALPESAFANGLRVCAREMPSGITGYWKVPPKVVDLIDAELMTHLRKSGIDQKLPFSAKLYLRQYAGFVRDGTRFVYVNALLVEKGKPEVADAKKAFPRSCAAVSGSWGIQYDTRTKQFLGFTTR